MLGYFEFPEPETCVPESLHPETYRHMRIIKKEDKYFINDS
jgi:hypothetical protein